MNNMKNLKEQKITETKKPNLNEQAGEQEILNHQQKMKVLDGIIITASDFIKKADEETLFKDITEAIETCTKAMKLQLYLEKLEIDKQEVADVLKSKEEAKQSEDAFFMEILNAEVLDSHEELEDMRRDEDEKKRQ
jgi:hypothetical protein